MSSSNASNIEVEMNHDRMITPQSTTTKSFVPNNNDASMQHPDPKHDTDTVRPILDRNVAPLHPTIVQDMIPYTILCIAMLHGIYMYFHNAYAHHKTMFFGVLQIPSPDDCRTINHNTSDVTHNEKCGRPDLFAFQMVSGLVFIVVSILGLHAWYHHRHTIPSTGTTTGTTKRYSLTTPASRLYGYQYESHIILIINLSYQIWDFVISIGVIHEYCTTIMLLHHFVAGLVAYYGLYNYMFSYYAMFFLGLSEVSSIFLVSLDLHKYFIPMTPSSLSSPTTTITSTVSNLFFVYSQHAAGPLFVITFIYYRIVLWYSVSKRLWDDVHSVTTIPTAAASIKSSTHPNTNGAGRPITTPTTSVAEQLRPHRTYVLYIWLYANLPMGVLQLYFLSIILYEIQAKFL